MRKSFCTALPFQYYLFYDSIYNLKYLTVIRLKVDDLILVLITYLALVVHEIHFLSDLSMLDPFYLSCCVLECSERCGQWSSNLIQLLDIYSGQSLSDGHVELCWTEYITLLPWLHFSSPISLRLFMVEFSYPSFSFILWHWNSLACFCLSMIYMLWYLHSINIFFIYFV